MATKAQVEALRWLIARRITESFDATVLAVKYEEGSDLRPNAQRVKSWKRTSGTACSRMRETGLLRYARLNPRPTYSITKAGFEAARDGT